MVGAFSSALCFGSTIYLAKSPFVITPSHQGELRDKKAISADRVHTEAPTTYPLPLKKLYIVGAFQLALSLLFELSYLAKIIIYS